MGKSLYILQLPALIIGFVRMLLAAVLENRCVVVLFAPFLLLLLLFVARLTAWFLLHIFDERHHLLHRFGGALNQGLHLLSVFFD